MFRSILNLCAATVLIFAASVQAGDASDLSDPTSSVFVQLMQLKVEARLASNPPKTATEALYLADQLHLFAQRESIDPELVDSIVETLHSYAQYLLDDSSAVDRKRMSDDLPVNSANTKDVDKTNPEALLALPDEVFASAVETWEKEKAKR